MVVAVVALGRYCLTNLLRPELVRPPLHLAQVAVALGAARRRIHPHLPGAGRGWWMVDGKVGSGLERRAAQCSAVRGEGMA